MGNPRGVKRDFEALERRRLEGLRLLDQGLNQSEVSRRLKVCSQSVSRWAKTLQEKGEKGLKAAGRAGRLPLLSVEQRQQLEKRLLEGSAAVELESAAAQGPGAGGERRGDRRMEAEDLARH